jgi:tetratricopeptide (TPR) repeat protein
VTIQREQRLEQGVRLEEAGRYFQLAATLNTNNIPATSNAEFNRSLRTGQSRVPETPESMQEKFGRWEPVLVDNGPFDHPDFCLRLGQVFSMQGLYRQAAIQFNRVRDLENGNLLAQAALADVFLKAKLPAESLVAIEQLRSQRRPETLPAELDLELARIEATALFSQLKTSEAEKVLRDAFARHPRYPAILDTLLQIYAQTDRLGDALETSEIVVAADPDRAESFINLAKLHLRNQEPARAIAAVDRVLQKSPQQPQALLYKIFLLIQAKEYASARSAIEALLNVDPENVEALLYKAVVEIETKAHARAIEPLTSILKGRPNDMSALRNRAVAYLELGELSKAEKDYNTMRRVVARDYVYVAYYGLGEIAYKRNDPARAIRYYELYLQNAPEADSPDLLEEKRAVADRLAKLKASRR